MDIKEYGDTPPWDWPEDAGAAFMKVLTDRGADEEDRVLAARLAGNACAVNDDLAEALLDVLRSPEEPEALRSRAAISFGPTLEQADTYGFDDPEDVMVTEGVIGRIAETLEALFRDDGVPKDVRRRILEAAVRAPREWHAEAIRGAYSSGDKEWRLTAVFCMRYAKGFEDDIIAALSADDDAAVYEALLAVGAWGVKAAWPRVSAILDADDCDKDVFLAAIEAAGGIGTTDAREALETLLDHHDQDVVAMASEAMAMAGFGIPGLDLDDEDEFDAGPDFPPHLLC